MLKDDGIYAPPLLPSLDIELEFGPPRRAERELIQGVQAPYLVFTSAQEIALAPLLELLKTLGYPLTNTMISYYSVVAGLFVYCGNDPLHGAFTIPVYEFAPQRVLPTQLRLRCREVLPNEFGSSLTYGQGLPLPYKSQDPPRSPGLRRTKERKIGYIIDKVMEWRRLYRGATNAQGEEVKCTLEQAASEVSISKKSLDDYLLQLRMGKKFGFNFQEHRDDKVGVLRAYVKRYKTIESLLRKEVLSGEELQELLKEAQGESSSMRGKAAKQVSLALLEPEQHSSPVSVVQTTRAQLPPLGVRLSKVDWTDVMKKHVEQPNSDFDSARTSFYCDKAVESATTALAQLYYHESTPSSPKKPRKHRKLRPVSLTASYEEPVSTPKPVSGLSDVTEVLDNMELALIQMKQQTFGFEDEWKVLENTRERLFGGVGKKNETIAGVNRLFGHYKELITRLLTAYNQTTFSLSQSKPSKPSPPDPSLSPYSYDLLDQRDRQNQAKAKILALETYINADNEEYERLKSTVSRLLDTNSAGTMEYLQKLHREMSKIRTLPDNLPIFHPNLSLNDWENELKRRFKDVQRETARKILQYFEKKAEISHKSLQTDFDYIDLDKYSKMQQKLAQLEANLKESTLKTRDLEGEIDIKQRVSLRLHSEIESERTKFAVLSKENLRLKDEFDYLLKTHKGNLKEMDEISSELKEKRQIVKKLRKENEEMKTKIGEKQFVIEWFETNHNNGFEQVKEVQRELRILYKQYFQPKLLSTVGENTGNQGRRRSFGMEKNEAFRGNLAEIRGKRRAKSENLGKRRMEETLGLNSEKMIKMQSKQGKRTGKVTMENTEIEGEMSDLEEKRSELEEKKQEEIEENAEISSEEEEIVGKTQNSRKIRGKNRGKERKSSESEVETVVDEPKNKSKMAKRAIKRKNKGKKSGLEGKGDEMSGSEGSEDEEEKESVLESNPSTVEPGHRGSARAVGRKKQGKHAKKDPKSEYTSTEREVQPRKSGHKGGDTASLETKSGRMVTDSAPFSGKKTHKTVSQGEDYIPKSTLTPRNREYYSRASGSPDSVSSPSSSIEYIGTNDKVCMTTADLVWPLVELNSVSVQYDYRQPEVVYETEEEGNAVVGPDGVKYYMWPLNPNQLYGLSGDVFYHTVMKAFQATPKIPLSKTGEPHQPAYVLDDTLAGSRLSGELRLHSTKPRPVDHSASCGKDCKHLRARHVPGKKEPLLPLARQDLKYAP